MNDFTTFGSVKLYLSGYPVILIVTLSCISGFIIEINRFFPDILL